MQELGMPREIVISRRIPMAAVMLASLVMTCTVYMAGAAGTITGSPEFLGCYIDKIPAAARALPLLLRANHDKMSLEWCNNRAYEMGFLYFGLQLGKQCWTGHSITSAKQYGVSSTCKMPCSGSVNQTCGGPLANSLYKTGTIPMVTKWAWTCPYLHLDVVKCGMYIFRIEQGRARLFQQAAYEAAGLPAARQLAKDQCTTTNQPVGCSRGMDIKGSCDFSNGLVVNCNGAFFRILGGRARQYSPRGYTADGHPVPIILTKKRCPKGAKLPIGCDRGEDISNGTGMMLHAESYSDADADVSDKHEAAELATLAADIQSYSLEEFDYNESTNFPSIDMSKALTKQAPSACPLPDGDVVMCNGAILRIMGGKAHPYSSAGYVADGRPQVKGLQPTMCPPGVYIPLGCVAGEEIHSAGSSHVHTLPYTLGAVAQSVWLFVVGAGMLFIMVMGAILMGRRCLVWMRIIHARRRPLRVHRSYNAATPVPHPMFYKIRNLQLGKVPGPNLFDEK